MDETKLTAALPNLDVQILHRTLPDHSGEAVSITLTATPSFDAAVAAMVPSLAAAMLSGGFSGGRAPLPLPFFPQTGTGADGTGVVLAQMWLAPMRLWMEAAQRAWEPWLAMTALRRMSDGR